VGLRMDCYTTMDSVVRTVDTVSLVKAARETGVVPSATSTSISHRRLANQANLDV